MCRCDRQDDAAVPGFDGPPVALVVDIAQERCLVNVAFPEVGTRIRQRMRARPSDILERAQNARRSPQTDEPVPAIRCRAEYCVSRAELSERCCDVVGPDRRDVGADDDNGTSARPIHDPLHPLAEIAALLPASLDVSRPDRKFDRVVRCDRKPGLPARRGRQSHRHGVCHVAVEERCRHHTDLARQPRLYEACAWLFRHYDEPARERRRGLPRRPRFRFVVPALHATGVMA